MSKTKKRLDLLISQFAEHTVKGTPEQVNEFAENLKSEWAVNFLPQFEKITRNKGEVYASLEAAKRLAKHLNLK